MIRGWKKKRFHIIRFPRQSAFVNRAVMILHSIYHIQYIYLFQFWTKEGRLKSSSIYGMKFNLRSIKTASCWVTIWFSIFLFMRKEGLFFHALYILPKTCNRFCWFIGTQCCLKISTSTCLRKLLTSPTDPLPIGFNMRKMSSISPRRTIKIARKLWRQSTWWHTALVIIQVLFPLSLGCIPIPFWRIINDSSFDTTKCAV